MKVKLCHTVRFTNLKPWKLGILTLWSLSSAELVAESKSQRGSAGEWRGEMKGISKDTWWQLCDYEKKMKFSHIKPSSFSFLLITLSYVLRVFQKPS